MLRPAFLLLFFATLMITMHIEYSKKDKIVFYGKVWNEKDGEVLTCSNMNKIFDGTNEQMLKLCDSLKNIIP